MTAERRTPAIEMRGITRRFPGVVANDRVDFSLRPGEIHALLGENGAGKSTLVNILAGVQTPDEGTILIDAVPTRFGGPQEAIARGIGMVHQHFMLVPTLSVTENIILGDEPSRAGLLDLDRSRSDVQALSARFGLAVDLDALVRDLPVGVQQRVEILKTLYRDASALLLDEPTAVLTPRGSEDLFRVMRELARQGRAIVFISHKLGAVLAVADRITVLRGGRVVGNRLPRETNANELAELMVGRPVVLRIEKSPRQPGNAILEVEGLKVADDRGIVAVDEVTFAVRSGEICGIAGIEGNGQTELIEALTGLRLPISGQVSIDGARVTGKGARRLFESGLAHIPEDRHRYSPVLDYSVGENLVLSSSYRFALRERVHPRLGRDSVVCAQTHRDVRHPDAQHRHADSVASGGAISRKPSSRGRCRAIRAS